MARELQELDEKFKFLFGYDAKSVSEVDALRLQEKTAKIKAYFFNFAKNYHNLGQHELALDILQKYLRVNQEDVDAYELKVEILEKLERFQELEDALQIVQSMPQTKRQTKRLSEDMARLSMHGAVDVKKLGGKLSVPGHMAMPASTPVTAKRTSSKDTLAGPMSTPKPPWVMQSAIKRPIYSCAPTAPSSSPAPAVVRREMVGASPSASNRGAHLAASTAPCGSSTPLTGRTSSAQKPWAPASSPQTPREEHNEWSYKNDVKQQLRRWRQDLSDYQRQGELFFQCGLDQDQPRVPISGALEAGQGYVPPHRELPENWIYQYVLYENNDSTEHPHVFLDVSVGGQPKVIHVVCMLFQEVMPRAAQCFHASCAPQASSPLLCTKPTNSVVQVAWPKPWDKPAMEEERPRLSHSVPGLLSMTYNSKGSPELAITLHEAKFLDADNTVIGRVVQGLDLLQNIRNDEREICIPKYGQGYGSGAA